MNRRNVLYLMSLSPALILAAPSTPRPLEPYETSDLERQMFQMVNRERRSRGLPLIEWDDVAAAAARSHALEMVDREYISHWDTAGCGPDLRYVRAGGRHSVMENVYAMAKRYDPGGGPAPIEDFKVALEEAHRKLMASPGHALNVLIKVHTHVGIGVAYSPTTGYFGVVEEFVNQYVTVAKLPLKSNLGDTVTVIGQLNRGLREAFINLAWQDLPVPMTPALLNKTSTFTSPARVYQPVPVSLDQDGGFLNRISLNFQNKRGLYSIRVWVKSMGDAILASECMIEVT